MIKKLLFLLVLLTSYFSGYSQCGFSGMPLTSVGNTVFCVTTPGTGNAVTTPTMRAGQFIVVDVVSGFTYRFSVGDVFTGSQENITLFNDADNSNFGPSGFATGAGGATITSWVAPFSGRIKVLLSRDNCVNNNTGSGTMTLTLLAVGNNIDNPNAFGTNTWVGHVYDYAGGGSPGGENSPSTISNTTSPFLPSNYVGSYVIPSETINTGFGGDNSCFNVLSGSVNRTNMNTQSFAVRYRMRSTRPAGCYLLNVNGDDGVRVYVDGALVFSRWREQGNTVYCGNLINLTGNNDIVLDYYENGGSNVLGFSLAPFDGSSNNIISSTNVALCSNTTTTITGSNVICNNPNTNTVYQWQSSANGTNFTDISGATGRDYIVPAVTVAPGAANNVRFFRRIFRPTTLGSGTCEFFTSTVVVTTSGSIPAQPGSVIGNTPVCVNTPNQVYSVPLVANATTYNWTVSSGWIITAGQGTNSITVTTGSAGGTVSVTAANGCGNSPVRNLTVNVVTLAAGQLNNVSNGFRGTTICTGGAPTLTFDADNNAVNVFPFTITYRNNASPTLYTQTITNDSAQTFTPGDNPTANASYTLVSISNVNCTRTTGFGSSTAQILFRPIPIATISGTTTVCKNAASPSVTFNNPQTAAVLVTYNINGGAPLTIAIAAGSNASVTVPTATANTFIYNLVSVIYDSPSICSNPITGSATVTVNDVIGDQVSFGNDSWIGYVYTSPDPANSNFSSNFVGVVNQPETFDLNLGGGTLTAPSLCGSYNDNFAIRFKMTKNFPAGCYTFTVGGDDGYRLSINGAPFLVEDWSEKPYVSTSGTVYLSGNTDLVLEYFERLGESRVSFSYTFQALNIPAVVSTVQPNCTLGTGSVVLSGLPTGSWTLTQSGFASATISGSGSERTISGLAPGTYFYNVASGSCTSNISQAIVINPVQTTTFDGVGWSTLPTLDKLGIITASNASPINIDENIELCSCEVSPGTNVVVDEGFVLKLRDRLVVSPTGSLTFSNNSSLVQINDGANNSGSINYLRQTTVVRKAVDYTYWSSPVAGQNLLAVSPNTNQARFWSFTPGGTWFVETPSTKIMDIGRGYIIRAPDFFPGLNPPSSIFEATFTGQPNNGVYNVPVGAAGTFNLIGNPYPSAVDAFKFLEVNQSVLNGTIYFWTHNTAIRDAQGAANEGTGDLVYIQDDYASFNRTGGVATAPAISDPNLASGSPRIPTGMIAAGQSFFASRPAGSVGSTVLFNNDMRLGIGNSSLDNSQFFRTAGTSKKENEPTRNRIWLNVTNKQKAFKQILVGYLNGATNDFDPSFDGATFNANTIINFYSMLGTRRLSIQGRSLPFDTADVVPLGYNAFIDGEFSISIDNVDGLFSSQAVYVEDKQTNTVHNLKTGPYTFQTVKGAFNERFVLRYTDRTLGVDDVELKDAQVVLSVKNKQLKVTSTADAIKDVYIYDLLGKLIFVKKNIGTAEFLISNLASSEQVLIVKTVLQNEAVSNLKAIYK